MQRSREIEQKQQHFKGTENILPNGYTTTDVQNYDQKSSGRSNSGATWNSLRSGRFFQATKGFMITDPAGSCHLLSVSRSSWMNSFSNGELFNILIV
ncbi:hypothetical protein TNCV_5104501 [Trichonephila clavipes]|nr:hypothetical protein TNCV_5104501 [Trichonephila clavipes]